VNLAKLIMFIFALAALLAMVSIGYSIAIGSITGSISAIIALVVVFFLGFSMKRKFRDQGLL
jgi:Ca2+/Na+ antiporter